jgi:ABC-type dipeptide/oligopeptide/nickel transport system ATPase component
VPTPINFLEVSANELVLIVDEPTTALDLTVQKEVLQKLTDLVKQQGTSLVFVSHDLPVVSMMAENIVVLQNGELVESATMETLFKNPQHQYSKKLVDTAIATQTEFSQFTRRVAL